MIKQTPMTEAGRNFRKCLNFQRPVTQTEVADTLKVTTSAVNQWARKGIPKDRAAAIMAITGAPEDMVESAIYEGIDLSIYADAERRQKNLAAILEQTDRYQLEGEDLDTLYNLVFRLMRA